MNDWPRVSEEPNTTVNSVFTGQIASDAGTGVYQMRIANDANFNDASPWLDYQSVFDYWQLPDKGMLEEMSTTVYFKVRDYLLRESLVTSRTIIAGQYTKIEGKV